MTTGPTHTTPESQHPGTASSSADASGRPPSLVHSITVAASVETVWSAITDPRFTEQYLLGLSVQSDWRAGTRIVFERGGETRIDGEILEIHPPKLLRHSLRLLRDAQVAAELPSRVTWELEEREDGCVVTVVHDEFVAETESYRIVGSGWPMILDGLRELLETGSARQAQESWPEFIERPAGN